MDFDTHYLSYLGITDTKQHKQVQVVECDYRLYPINKRYYYPIISTRINNRYVCSSSQKYYKLCTSLYDGTHESMRNITEAMAVEIPPKLRHMRRYSIEHNKKLSTEAQVLTPELVNTLDVDFNRAAYLHRKRKVIEAGSQFVIVKEGKIASTAFISDIYNGGGNIVVFTSENYRGIGLGKEVVKACLNWCTYNDVIPVYFVDVENKASINLAESLEFRLMSEECVISQ